MNCENIYKFIEENRESMVKDIRELISIPSVSSDRRTLAEALKLTLNKGEEMGFKVKSLLDDRVGIIEMGEGDETLGILVHVDVVEAGDNGSWRYPPFSGIEAEGYVWGRGAMDDKGPIISSLYAMKAVKEMGLPLNKKVQLIIGTQEEVAWTEIHDFVKSYPLPDYGFTPDGEFPITNREKGYADVEISFEKNSMAILNKGEFELIEIKGGVAVNSIPASCQGIIRGNYGEMCKRFENYLKEVPGENIKLHEEDGKIVVSAGGKAAHSGYPEKGVNAVEVFCKFLHRIPLIKNGLNRVVDFIYERIADDFYGRGMGLYSESEYVNGEFMHRNVISPTVIGTSDRGIHVNFNLRTSYGTTKEDVLGAFQKFSNEYGFTFRILDYLHPIFIEKNKAFLRTFGEVYDELSGFKNEFIIAHGTSYAKAMPNIVAWGPVFPGEEDCCHEANERISTDSLIKATKIYATAIAKIALSEESYK